MSYPGIIRNLFSVRGVTSDNLHLFYNYFYSRTLRAADATAHPLPSLPPLLSAEAVVAEGGG